MRESPEVPGMKIGLCVPSNKLPTGNVAARRALQTLHWRLAADINQLLSSGVMALSGSLRKWLAADIRRAVPAQW